MKVLLVNPPVADRDRGHPVVERLFYNSMPLGIGYLAAVAEQGGHRAGIIDGAVEQLSAAQLLRRVAEFDPDVIGVTGLTTSFASTQSALHAFHEHFPRAVLLTGGPHLSAWGAPSLEGLPVAAGVAAEGELAFGDILCAIENNTPLRDIQGIFVQDERGEWIETGPRRYYKDLDDAPFPARHLFKKHLYQPIPADYRHLPKIPIMSARGCPYGCIFCDKSVFGRRLRGKSPKRTVDEIEHCIRDHGARGIAFLDSTFGTDRKRAREICEEIIRRNVKVEWTCTLRADSVDEEMLALFRRAGCWKVRLGIESGDEEIFARLDKGETLDHVRRAAVAADKVGLQSKAFFIVGHLGENEKTLRNTVNFAKSLPLMEVTVQINTPMKNTPQEEMWHEFGDLDRTNLTNSSFWEPVFVPTGLTRDELVRWQNRFYREFLLRPSVWWRHLRHLRGWADIKRYGSAVSLLAFLLFNRELTAFRRRSAELATAEVA